MSEEIIFKFFSNKDMFYKMNFFQFNDIDDIIEWAYEKFNISPDLKIIFKIPPEFKNIENLKIDCFYDNETYKYFINLIIKIYNKDPKFFKNQYKIEIKIVSKYPNGIPTLQKLLRKTIKDNILILKLFLKSNLTNEVCKKESYKFNIDKLKNKKFVFACHNNIVCNNCLKKNFYWIKIYL